MRFKFGSFVISAAVAAVALIAGAAQASGPNDSTLSADKYGYNFRVGKTDAFTDGARTGKFDSFGEGARQVDPYTDGARTVAGLDRSGVSSDPARSVDVYLDGAMA
ncbi:hypothetical protein AB4Z48_18630 [Cupriavidus sp. 2TAF22]|uniref:hypothetical protein n=1 Tax=unclassified Cupriavidus TaxID=2640874 RepID=UPI003F91EDC4